ncbi:MAG: hypothetical protein FWE10_07410 [Rikenellaceae bacterium]|nr:hypothetical protein [Rikenellaceae bacterium]
MKRTAIFLTCVLAMLACDDIFEIDLTDKTVSVIAPSDGSQVMAGDVTFLWHEVEGARTYRLRILEKLADGGRRAVSDTIMHNDSNGIRTHHRATLGAGVYEWSIAAANGAYRTAERMLTLHVIEDEEPGDEPVDISGEQIEIIAPFDGAEVKAGEMTFLWHEVQGATAYRIIIVGPSFDKATVVIADETLSGEEGGAPPCSFTCTVEPGEYEWSIVAMNDGYKTAAHVFAFSVSGEEEPDDPEDISNEVIGIIAPFDGAILTPGEVTFLWREVRGATSYHITIVGPSFDKATVVVANETLSGAGGAPPNSYKCSIGVGRYEWSIRARNERSETEEYFFSFEVAEPPAEEEP